MNDVENWDCYMQEDKLFECQLSLNPLNISLAYSEMAGRT